MQNLEFFNNHQPGLEKVLISPWLVTLLQIFRVIPTPQSPISPETPRDRRRCRAEVCSSSADMVASNDLLAIADIAAPRFGKSTYISMINNSVIPLQSYTNFAIADIAGNSTPILPVTPRDHCRRRDEVCASSADIVTSNDLCVIADVAAPNADVFTSSADIVASNDDCFIPSGIQFGRRTHI